ncbi:MAG TPA: hypothetical protein P5293_06595 [Bacteroidales bacterium]|nr:hypothetical protein [Bacteroidales bacterium]
MKESTYRGLVKVIERLDSVQKKIRNSFNVSETNLDIKDAREYGYISSSIKDLEDITDELKTIRSLFFLKDE